MNNIFLIHGEDDFLAKEKLDFFKQSFIKKYGDLNISTYNEDSCDLDKITNDLFSSPFLSEKKMVIVNSVLSSWKKDSRAKFISKMDSIPETTVLFIFESKSLDDKKNKLSELNEVTKKIDPQNIFVFKKSFGNEIVSYIQKVAKDNNYTVDIRAVNTLVSLVGPKTREINQELKKLMAYKYETKTISAEDVSNLVKSQINKSVFDLTDVLSKKDFKNAKLIVKNLAESGENPISILAMITTHFRNMLYIKTGETNKIDKEEVIKETKMHPFVYQKTSAQVKRFTLKELKKIYQEIGNTDTAIKTGEKEGELGLDLLIGKICL